MPIYNNFGILVENSDNTRIHIPVESKLRRVAPRERLVRKSEIKLDNRSKWQRERDRKIGKYRERQKKAEKDKEELKLVVSRSTDFISPSTYIGPLFRRNGKSYKESVLSGNGTGNPITNVIIDLFTPAALFGAFKFTKAIKDAAKTGIHTGRLLSKVEASLNATKEERQLIDKLFRGIMRGEYGKYSLDLLMKSEYFLHPMNSKYNGIVFPRKMSKETLEYSNVIRERFGKNLPKNFDFEKNLYTIVPTFKRDVNGKLVRSGEGFAGFHQNRDGKSYISYSDTEPKLTEIHEAVSHGTERYLPLSIIDEYKRLTSLLSPNVPWNEVRATSKEIDAYMRKKYGPDYYKKIDLYSPEYDQEMVNDLWGKLYNISGYGKSIVEGSRPDVNRVYSTFIKTLPLPVTTGIVYGTHND